jgi:hypothetical protein
VTGIGSRSIGRRHCGRQRRNPGQQANAGLLDLVRMSESDIRDKQCGMPGAMLRSFLKSGPAYRCAHAGYDCWTCVEKLIAAIPARALCPR